MQLPEFYFNGEAIYGTRPWRRYKDTAADGGKVRYTSKGAVHYAIVIKLPADKILTLPADLAGSATLLETAARAGRCATPCLPAPASPPRPRLRRRPAL
jgi:hypothetical protein